MEGARILVVDDDAAIQAIVGSVLSWEGYEVVPAMDGAAALEALAQGSLPELILLDMAMPGMDGQQFVHIYRQLPAPQAPIIAFSAGNAAVDLPVAGVLGKPFDIDDLLDMVGRHTRPE